MLVKYSDSIGYLCIICFSFLFVIICILAIIYFIFKIYYSNKISKKYKLNKYSDMANKDKKCLFRFVAIFIIVLFISCFLLYQKRMYAVCGNFMWGTAERDEKTGIGIEVVERDKVNKQQWYQQKLHMEWYDKKEGEYIDEKMINRYKKEVDNCFSVVPQKNNNGAKVDEVAEVFQDKLDHYSYLVGEKHKNISSEELWRGYEDGVEVCKIYETSENVFQTGVLAESACDNFIKSQQNGETYLLYMAGMVERFEEFLNYLSGDIGQGEKVSPEEVCFRIEKKLYYVGTSGLCDDVCDDEKIIRHCSLYAYSCSQYVLERTELNKDNYLKYLKYLYYSGLCLLNVKKYINDEKLCVKLCKKELQRWDALERTGFLSHEKGKKKYEKIMLVKKSLENYVSN